MSASVRIAIVILVLLLLPVVFGPVVIGLLIERGVERVMEGGAAQGVEIELDRGLYTSRLRTVIALADEPGAGGRLVAEHVIVHGPIPLAAPVIGRSPADLVIVLVHSKLVADPEAMPDVAEALAGEPLATVFTRVTSTGEVDAKIDAPPFALDDRFVWGGLVGHVEVRDTGRRLTGEFTANGVRFADDDVSVTFEPGTSSFDADLAGRRMSATVDQKGSEWVFGDHRFEAGPIQIEADQPIDGDVLGDAQSVWTFTRLSGQGGLGEDDFDVTGLRIEQLVEFDPEAGLHRGELAIGFDAWRVGEAPADGPGGLRMQLERIDRDAIERFRGAIQALERSGKSPEEIQAMRPFVVMQQVPDLLASSPVFEVRDGFVEGPEGRLEASLRVAVDGSQPELLADPFMLMGLIEAHATMAGPEPLVRRFVERLVPHVRTAEPVAAQAPGGAVVSSPVAAAAAAAAASRDEPDRFDAWLEAGTFVRDGDLVRFEARFENGMPFLNGQPADPELITSLLPGM